MVWSGLDDLLLTGHDNGDLVQWDVKTGKKLKMSSDHGKTITVGGNKDADKDPLLDKVTQWEKQNRQ